MQIYSDTEAVLFKNGYFVVYHRNAPNSKGKLPKWAKAGTYASPPKHYLHLVPLWEESKRKASMRGQQPQGLATANTHR